MENPEAAARYDLATDGTQAPSYFVVGGIHYRRAAWEVGLAYASAPLGSDGTVKLALERSQVTPPATAPTSDLCSALGHSPCVSGEMRYHLPDLFTAGVTWHATPHLDAVGIVRWVRYGSYDRITIRLVGPSSDTLLGTSLPDQLVLYRGFQDSWDMRARLVHAPWPWFRWSGTLRVETSAVPEANVNAAAVDGLKLEPALAAEFALGRHLRIAAGYALTWMFPVTVSDFGVQSRGSRSLRAGGWRSFLARMPDAPGGPGAPDGGRQLQDVAAHAGAHDHGEFLDHVRATVPRSLLLSRAGWLQRGAGV